ncbi:MAG: hypothetical protein ACI3ZL_06610 [Candidatus Cryptobacteroides sp.]
MKKARIIFILSALLVCTGVEAAERTDTTSTERRRMHIGYDGGMMLHTGWLWGEISPVGYKAGGMPVGIGGAIRFHIGRHFRIGTEGYASNMRQMRNGSSIKYGWGGLLADFCFTTGKMMPYAGVTVGGGGRTCTLMFEGDSHDWEKEESVIFHKEPFFAVAPFIGTDFIVTPKFHLTLKADWMCAFSGGSLLLPTGPRIYFGFLMYH